MMNIDVDVTVLGQAAQQAQESAQGLVAARQAAKKALPKNAFGILCYFPFKPIYDFVLGKFDDALETLAETDQKAATNLKTMADAYAEVEKNMAEAIKKIQP